VEEMQRVVLHALKQKEEGAGAEAPVKVAKGR
jgi:hypothetical protein